MELSLILLWGLVLTINYLISLLYFDQLPPEWDRYILNVSTENRQSIEKWTNCACVNLNSQIKVSEIIRKSASKHKTIVSFLLEQ